MTEDRLARFGPLSGALFVLLELAGFAIGSAGGRATVTLADPTSKIVKAFADPVGTGVWVGAYLELASLAAFVVFAAWLFRSQRGPLATAGMITAAVYAAITIVSLVIGDVLEYRAGHGIDQQAVLSLFDLQSGMYVVSWGISAGFLALAPVTGWLRRSALAHRRAGGDRDGHAQGRSGAVRRNAVPHLDPGGEHRPDPALARICTHHTGSRARVAIASVKASGRSVAIGARAARPRVADNVSRD